MVKTTTIKEVGEMMRHVVKHMATKDETASKDDIANVRGEMADGIAAIMSELVDIKRRLKDVEEAAGEHSKHTKEIDYAFERIAAIEKHIGLKSKARA